MPRYGILKNATNTGADDELQTVFVAPLSVIAVKPSYGVDTANYRRVTVDPFLHRWEIRAGAVPTNDGDISEFAHKALHGHTGIFHVRVPQPAKRKMAPQGHIVTSTVEYQPGTTTLALNCTTLPDALEGGFIRFAGHAKVYLLMSCSKSSNTHTITITPPLKRPVAAGEVVKYGIQVTMQCSYSPDTVLAMSYEDGLMTKIDEVSLIERD